MGEISLVQLPRIPECYLLLGLALPVTWRRSLESVQL